MVSQIYLYYKEMKAVSAQVVSCCVYDKPLKIMQHMHRNISHMFDFLLGLSSFY